MDWSNFAAFERSFPNLQNRSPSETRQFSEQAIYHGAFRLDPSGNWIEYLNDDGSQANRILFADKENKVSSRDIINLVSTESFYYSEPTKWAWKHPQGSFDIPDHKELQYYASSTPGVLWKQRLLYELDGVEGRKGSQDFIAWTQSPPTLYFLVWGQGSLWQKSVLHTYKWTEDSEPLAFFYCDKTHAILLENLKNGLLRIFYFQADSLEGLKPLQYSLRTYKGGGSLSGAQEISAYRNQACKDIFLAGSFGLVKESFNWD